MAFNFLRNRKAVRSTASIPPGMRVYAIGDVHGRADLLELLLTKIEADNARRPAADVALILLGDLVDRGPDSVGVVKLARSLCGPNGRGRFLKGNHEEIFLSSAQGGDPRLARAFLMNGGPATLTSYGISEDESASGSFDDLAALIRARVPAEDLAFLDSGEDMIRIGGYAFVHAGVRPNVPLDQQKTRDLRWIRSTFTDSAADHGAIIVHGHTVTAAPEEMSNRIGIDTGAYASGILTALGLEGGDRWFLNTAADNR